MSNRTELIDKIRADVAKEHDVLLGRNDPIFITVAINEALLNHYADVLDQRLEASNEKAMMASQAAVVSAKDSAGKLITEAATYVRDQVQKAVEEGVRKGHVEAAKSIKGVEAAASEAQTAANAAKWAAILAGFAAAAAIGVAIGALIAK